MRDTFQETNTYRHNAIERGEITGHNAPVQLYVPLPPVRGEVGENGGIYLSI